MSEGRFAAESTPDLVILKIGGSLVSDKKRQDHLDLDALGAYADIVAGIVQEFPGRLVFVAGGGSLGHEAARNLPFDEPWAPLRLTNATFRVKWAWVKALRARSITALPLQVSAMVRDSENGLVASFDVLSQLLAGGHLPVLSGDVILDEKSGLRILGSDHVAGALLPGLQGKVRVVTLTDVPGLLETQNLNAKVFPYVDANYPAAAERLIWPSPAWDTSGAMSGKLASQIANARLGAQCVIMQGTEDAEWARLLFQPLSQWPATPLRTLVSTEPRYSHTVVPNKGNLVHKQASVAAKRTILMNPGPVNVHPAVRAAIASEDLCHREPEARDLMDRTRSKATAVAGGTQDFTSVLLTGSGTAAMEAVISSVVPAEGRLLILHNGHYAQRMFDIAERNLIPVSKLEFGWIRTMLLEEIRNALLNDSSITHVGLVHHETSTGMINPLREIGKIVHDAGRQLIVDTISSLGSEQVDVVMDNIDWCIGTSNKCLEGLPGVSFVTATRTNFELLSRIRPRSYYLNLHGHYEAQEHKGAPLFTPAVQVTAAFDVALDLMLAEGVAGRSQRYTERALHIRSGLGARGAAFLLEDSERANSVTTVKLPAGVSYTFLHDELKSRGFVIYATQEQLPGYYRVANMGQLEESDISGFLAAYDEIVPADACVERSFQIAEFHSTTHPKEGLTG